MGILPLEAGLDTVIGALTGTIRTLYLLFLWVYVNVIRPLASVIGIRFPDGKREKTPGGKIKVAVVGYGRTGTVR